MKNNFNPEIDERIISIVIGILSSYALILFFILYFYFMHKISLKFCIISGILFTFIYLPRFNILRKIQTNDTVKITDNSVKINDSEYKFDEITDFRINEKKSKAIFFMSNKMVVYKEATFYLKTKNGVISFTIFGSEKIRLLKSFLTELLNSNN